MPKWASRLTRWVLLSAVLCAHAAKGESDWEWYRGMNWQKTIESLHQFNKAQLADASAPLYAPLQVCVEVSCGRLSEVALTPVQAEQISSLFSPPSTSAEEERARIARAVAYFEQFVGAANGSWNDRAKNTTEWDEEGQLDCVDEATNTQVYLERLSAANLLRYHDLGRRVVRYRFIFQHFAYEIVDRATGTRYIVDSWIRANGETPVIEPYAKWRTGWGNL